MDGPLRDPEIPDGEEAAYRGFIGGHEAGAGTMRVERVQRGGIAYYRQTLEGRVLERLDYGLEMMFQRRSGLLLADSYRLATSNGERRVALEEGSFRDVEALGFGGTIEPYPRSIVPLLGCAVALRGLDFRRDARHELPLWLANTVWWEVHLRVERVEQVELPCGRRSAWRVRAKPSFERVAGVLDRVIDLLLPPFVLHFGAEPPHPFLRFEFPTGPFRWNPRGLIEATRLPA